MRCSGFSYAVYFLYDAFILLSSVAMYCIVVLPFNLVVSFFILPCYASIYRRIDMKRLDFIDTAKGICILLIMLGHCATGTVARHNLFLITWVYSFHTAAFFIITGMLMEHTQEHKRHFKTVLASNIKRILIPYFIFQMLYAFWYCLMHGFKNIKWLITDILLLIGWDYASWFLLALFIAKITVIVIRHLFKVHAVANALVLSLFILGLSLCVLKLNPSYYWLYQHLVRALLGVGFIVAGSILYKYIAHLNSIKVLVVSLCLSLGSSYKNGLVSMFHLSVGNPVLYVISAICGTIFILTVSNHINNRVITLFGKKSIIAMGLHQIILWSFPIQSIFMWFIISPLTAIFLYIATLV